MEGAAAGLDEDLYSRQLYVMGKTAMAKMGKADVLISGMRFVCRVCRVIMEKGVVSYATTAVDPNSSRVSYRAWVSVAHVSSPGACLLALTLVTLPQATIQSHMRRNWLACQTMENPPHLLN